MTSSRQVGDRQEGRAAPQRVARTAREHNELDRYVASPGGVGEHPVARSLGAAGRAAVGDQFLLGRGVPEGGPGEARHLLAPVVVGHAHHGHCRQPGIRPAWRTGHRPVLTSLRICKSCSQALNGNRERSMQETAHHRDQPDKDREYLRPPRAPQVPFAAATAHGHAQARIGVMVTSPSRPGLH